VGGRGARLDDAEIDLEVNLRYHLVGCSWVCGARAKERRPGRVLDL
jgi:hypothetical protein